MERVLVWFRQDLRCYDNAALYEACKKAASVVALYIKPGRDALGEAQHWWLHYSLQALQQKLAALGVPLCLKQGEPLDVLQELYRTMQCDAIFWNRCYEPDAIARDTKLKTSLKQQGILVQSFAGALLNEPMQVLNQQGTAFKVFTPYWKAASARVHVQEALEPTAVAKPLDCQGDRLEDWYLLPTKPDWASRFSEFWEPGEEGAKRKLEDFVENRLNHYKEGRNFPAERNTSLLSPHLHFGEISPKTIWRTMHEASIILNTQENSRLHFLSELGWREFSYYLLYHFPHMTKRNFRENFENFPWHEDKAALRAWQKGETGYPIVDAGMRELWATGYMHNRVRMIVASFLTKDLFIDWREGAAWFWDTLLDADLANNTASWQWVAGSGADAAPYFRIFNPVLQGEKFDPTGEYVRRWIPELRQVSDKYVHKPWEAPTGMLMSQYPKPIVQHDEARRLALQYYEQIKREC